MPDREPLIEYPAPPEQSEWLEVWVIRASADADADNVSPDMEVQK